MMMKIVLAAVLAAAMPVFGAGEEQYVSQMPPSATLTLGEMDALTKPLVAMPDSLLAVVLPASTYPVEIVMAQRWVAKHPEATAAEIDGQAWPEPVRALAHDAATLKMMSDDLEWTQTLGKAFLAEGDEVLRTVQRSRTDAHKAGTLRIVQGDRVTQMDGVVAWPARVGGEAPQVVIPPAVNVVAGPEYGFGGGNYGCDWGNYVIVDSAGVDWRCRLGAVGYGGGRERGGVATIVNGPGAVIVGGRGYGGGYGGVVYQPAYTGNVIVTSGPQTLYGAPTFQRAGYSFSAPLIGTPVLGAQGGRVGGRRR